MTDPGSMERTLLAGGGGAHSATKLIRSSRQVQTTEDGVGNTFVLLPASGPEGNGESACDRRPLQRGDINPEDVTLRSDALSRNSNEIG